MRAHEYDLELSLMRLREKRNRRKILIRLFVWCVCIWALLHRMYGISVVSGNSMRPSFYSGDVVIFRRGVPKNLEYGDMLRNGMEIRESEILHGYQQTDAYVTMPYRVPDESYFCLGDNRPVSLDSRVYGAVPGKQVKGKVLLVLRLRV